jgi:hypothetical protein
MSSVPWIFDVFASMNNTRAYFIAENPLPCHADHSAYLHLWEGEGGTEEWRCGLMVVTQCISGCPLVRPTAHMLHNHHHHHHHTPR